MVSALAPQARRHPVNILVTSPLAIGRCRLVVGKAAGARSKVDFGHRAWDVGQDRPPRSDFGHPRDAVADSPRRDTTYQPSRLSTEIRRSACFWPAGSAPPQATAALGGVAPRRSRLGRTESAPRKAASPGLQSDSGNARAVSRQPPALRADGRGKWIQLSNARPMSGHINHLFSCISGFSVGSATLNSVFRS
jgi:hypothetical protein